MSISEQRCDQPWWKEAVVYQIYPASFKDSNGDGIGDLQGIISGLDYIQELGATCVWICPVYDSPQYDMGYDVSDYEAIYEPYGSLKDMDQLIDACHARGLRILVDLVINHTSHEHAWFQESRSSRDNPKRDWYHWRPAKFDEQGNRRPPNNWASSFGGSAWEWDEGTQEYYLHLFCSQQPDLNFENATARAAIYETAMHFWLRKGVDGFRIDVVNLYSKDPSFPDAAISRPEDEYQPCGMDVTNGPRIHEFLGEMNAILAQYGTTMTVGELGATHKSKDILPYVSAAEKQLDMVFQFTAVDVGYNLSFDDNLNITPGGENWTVPQLAAAVGSTQELLQDSDGWTTAFLENHDLARSVSRWGNDSTEEYRSVSAKMLATMEAALSGTLFIYQGQEIGMTNMPMEWSIDEYKDVFSINTYASVKASGNSAAMAKALGCLQHLGRDNARYPFSWSAAKHAGFSPPDATQEPWMRVHTNHTRVNAEAQIRGSTSVLSFWKHLLRLRREFADCLIHGQLEALQARDPSVFVFQKKGKQQTAVVALNFTMAEQKLADGTVYGQKNRLMVSNIDGVRDGILRPFEAQIWIRE